MKGYLLVLSSIFLFLSCSKKFTKTNIIWPKDTVKQKILISLKSPDENFSNVKIYSKISKKHKIAQLEAFKYNIHLFSLVIKNSNYYLTKHQDGTSEFGKLNDFKFFNTKFNIFKDLNIYKKQPIVLKNDNLVTLLIKVIEEKPLYK